jgi:hypothetical protein
MADSRLDEHSVHVAPAPVFSGLEGPDDRVAGGVEALGGVSIFGVVAASRVAADGALAQVNPGVFTSARTFRALISPF